MRYDVKTNVQIIGSKDIGDAAWKKKLSKQEYYVLREKGTDPRHMTVSKGGFDDLYDAGSYFCRACGTKLYDSSMKFDCGCGWPGFWTNVPNAVREEPDTDGFRVEILCNACNGHLGHVFRNEGFSNPAPNERHCVNSTSLKFVPAEGDSDKNATKPAKQSSACGS